MQSLLDVWSCEEQTCEQVPDQMWNEYECSQLLTLPGASGVRILCRSEPHYAEDFRTLCIV